MTITHTIIDRPETALKILGEEIIDIYGIEIDNAEELAIHEPAYCNVRFNKKMCITEDATTFALQTKQAVITLWKNTPNMHITIL